jgi:hypothetical protein
MSLSPTKLIVATGPLTRSCAVRYKRHPDEWQSRLTLVARDEHEIMGERGCCDPEIVRWSSPAGSAQLAVAGGDRAINIDDGSLCEDSGQQPQSQGACRIVRCQQHARLKLADRDGAYCPRLTDLRRDTVDQDACVNQRCQVAQASWATARSSSRI